MKNNYVHTISELVFIVLGFFLVILISLGISLDFSRIKTAIFWVEVLGQFGLTMVTFNFVYYLDRKNRMHNKESRFYNAWATNRLRVTKIENDKLYEQLDQAVEEENLLRLKKKCNNKLYKLCSRVDYDEVTDLTKTPEAICKEYRVVEKYQKKMIKLIDNIRGGRVKVKKITAQVFLIDKELHLSRGDEYDFNNATVELERNGAKAVTFFACSILSASVLFSLAMPNFWISLFKNATFIFGAIISGFSSSIKNIKLRTSIYERRNVFLQRYLNLTEKYDFAEED